MPSLKYLKVFGSTAYVHIKLRKQSLIKSRGKGYVGYEPSGYRVLERINLEQQEMLLSMKHAS